jgi:branched-subunit amino acid permease
MLLLFLILCLLGIAGNFVAWSSLIRGMQKGTTRVLALLGMVLTLVLLAFLTLAVASASDARYGWITPPSPASQISARPDDRPTLCCSTGV